jgi:hypothetical protein
MPDYEEMLWYANLCHVNQFWSFRSFKFMLRYRKGWLVEWYYFYFACERP